MDRPLVKGLAYLVKSLAFLVKIFAYLVNLLAQLCLHSINDACGHNSNGPILDM